MSALTLHLFFTHSLPPQTDNTITLRVFPPLAPSSSIRTYMTSHPHPHHFDDDAANDDDGERAYGYGIMSGTQAFTAARDEDMLRRRESGVSSGGGAGITAAQKMLAACSGSLLTSLLVTPLDVVRVRLQSQHPASLPRTTATAPTAAAARNTPLRAHKLPLSPLRFQSTAALSAPELGVTACCREVFWITNASEACIALSPSSSQTSFTDSCVVEETSRRRFHGTWEGLVKIARYEGITSLWRGLSPTLLMAIPANVIYFTGYDALRGSPWSPFSALGATWAPLLAGSSARAIAATAISPLELFRTRLQATGAHSFRDTAAGVRSMVATEGVASLWRGLGLTLWRDVPFSGVYWFGYEAIRDGLRRRREREWRRDAPLRGSSSSSSRVLAADIHAESTFADSFIAGATSGAVAALLTTPFDVGKTRRQVAIGRGAAVAGESLVGVLSAIWSAEGIAGLMRGAVPRMLKVAPACAIMISSYEVGKKAATGINQRAELQV